MKFVKYIFLGSDGDDSFFFIKLVTLMVIGYYSGNIDGGCEGEPPTSTSNAHTITLNDDCTFSTNAYSIYLILIVQIQQIVTGY